MYRKLFISIVMLMLMVGVAQAQQVVDTPTEPTEVTGSNYTVFAVMCENQAIVNFAGNMEPGDDLYYQAFNGSQGTGGAISSLRQASLDGNFIFSETIPYNEGATIPFGSIGSLYVTISSDSDVNNSDFSEYVDDIQDGCATPQNPPISSTGIEGSVGEAGTVDTTPVQLPGTKADGTSNILSPFGGVLNPNYVPPQINLVTIGARPDEIAPRQETPGLIFAECNDYRVALPGVVYDTDNVVVYWSWFANSEELVQEHIDNVNYHVSYYQAIPVPNVQVSDIQKIGSNYWVFYTSQLGNLRPGQYYIEYDVNWELPISDGFGSYGPGTDNETLNSGCGFDVLPNLEGTTVNHNKWPFND